MTRLSSKTEWILDMHLVAQLSDGQSTTLIHWVITQGPWAAFTVALLALLYFGGRRAFDHVIIPITNRVLAHFDSLGTHLTNLSKTMTEMSGAVCKLNDTLDGVSAKLNQIDQKTTMIVEEHQNFIDVSKDDRRDMHQRIERLEDSIGRLPKVMP